MGNLSPIAQAFLDRVKDKVAQTSSVGRLSHWLEKNTTIFGRPFTFVGHEFQRDIVDCPAPNVAIIKPSQVGLSECSARLTLAFLAVESNSTAIYTMPTVHEATRFAKSRFDPVIEGSKYLSSIMMTGGDSASFKRIGSSQIFFMGTFAKALISVPTDFLCCDEIDFSNEETLRTAESRLTHSRFHDKELNIRGFRRKFSTPTVTGLGVSALFANSDKRRRLVKCMHCHEWFHPNFLFDVVVQGFDRPMDEIQHSDVQDLDERGLLDTAKLICPHCHGDITQRNLQPDYREWVAECPSVKHQVAFQVSPFDLPDYHSPTSILRKRLEYGNEEGHFRNFTLGLPHDSSTNSIEADAVSRNTELNPEYPENSSIGGCVLGLDIGKTSWLVIGKKVSKKETHIIWAEQIRVRDNDDNLFRTVVERINQFRVVKACIDSAPFFDTVIRIRNQFPDLIVLPVMYTLRDAKLPAFLVDENDLMVKANRTKVIDLLVQKVNTNQYKFPRHPETSVIAQHLQGMKRIEQTDEKGVITADWVRTGTSDHYFHALSYLNIAAQMVEEGMYINFAPLPSIKEAVIGLNHLEETKPIGLL